MSKPQITVQVDERTFKAVYKRAKLEGRPVAQWIRQLIRAALAKGV